MVTANVCSLDFLFILFWKMNGSNVKAKSGYCLVPVMVTVNVSGHSVNRHLDGHMYS